MAVNDSKKLSAPKVILESALPKARIAVVAVVDSKEFTLKLALAPFSTHKPFSLPLCSYLLA